MGSDPRKETLACIFVLDKKIVGIQNVHTWNIDDVYVGEKNLLELYYPLDSAEGNARKEKKVNYFN